GQVAVGDGGAVGRLGPGPVGVAVDPLAVQGHVGEGVDPLLRDGQPVADADLLADEALEFRGAVDDALRHGETCYLSFDFENASLAASWNPRRTSDASEFGKFARWTMRM